VFVYPGYTTSAITRQSTQYYPSGLPWASNATDYPGTQPYKYNGKEFVEMHGYDSYDYGFRGMHSAKMRFDTPDALMETHYDISPYAYCLNNPVNFIDPFGLDTCTYNPIDNTYSSIENPSLQEVTVKGKSSNSNQSDFSYFQYWFSKIKVGIDYASTAASTYAGIRYTASAPWRTGHFKTSRGKVVPLSVLKPKANGKFVPGKQGFKYGAKFAKASVRLLTRATNFLGGVTTLYSADQLIQDPSFSNGFDVGIGVASYMWWEVGTYSAAASVMILSTSGEREQIQQNIMSNESPLNNVYVPGLGTNY